ncbi:MAG: M48 family peptidase, partial [Nitrospiraceae bacterium]
MTGNFVIRKFFSTPVSRRAALYLGARGALAACSALGLFGSLWGCYRAPGTGREQLIFISEEKEMAMGVRAFRDVLRGTRLNENPEINEMVNRVGQRIAAAARRPEYHWEFAVIQ